MPKRFNKGLVRLHEWAVASRKPWLIQTHSRIRELAVYAVHFPMRLFFHPSRFQNNFIIYAQPRTGSTVLVDLLNSSPFVCCEREIFVLQTIGTESFLKAKRSLYPDKAYGCKIMGYQLERQVSFSEMQPFLQKMHDQGWKIIHLARRNILRQALSQLLVRRGGRLHRLTNDCSPLTQVHIDVNELQQTLQKIEITSARDEAILTGISHLKLTYEDSLLQPEKHQDTLDKVFTYLGLPISLVHTRLRRITPKEISSFVGNFEEVKSFLDGTPYAKFVELP